MGIRRMRFLTAYLPNTRDEALGIFDSRFSIFDFDEGFDYVPWLGLWALSRTKRNEGAGRERIIECYETNNEGNALDAVWVGGDFRAG